MERHWPWKTHVMHVCRWFAGQRIGVRRKSMLYAMRHRVSRSNNCKNDGVKWVRLCFENGKLINFGG